MPHDHQHIHPHHHSTENIKTAFFLNLSFTIIEIVGGILTNSVAILTDAIHDLGDSVSIGSSWYLEKISKKQRTKSFSYGFTRFSLLAALLNINVLIIGSILVLRETFYRLSQPEDVNTQGMLLLSILGIIVNGIAVLKLEKGKSINEKVVKLHLLEDVLGWVAILIGSVIMHFWNVPILDPILSIAIALYILYGAIKNLKGTLSIFLQGVPKNINIEIVDGVIRSHPNINDVHDIHIWSLDGDYHVLSAHLVVDESLSLNETAIIKSDIQKSLKELNIPHSTLEFEIEGEDCALDKH